MALYSENEHGKMAFKYYNKCVGSEKMFKRKAYVELQNWKKEYSGTRAALLEGARRVGKSTIAKEFAKKEYKSYILIDFGNVARGVLDVFDDISNLDFFFMRLQAATKTKLYEKASVIIFDEVQLFPKARQAIKYLVADGRYDYIETGSFISIRKNVQDILIPSEEVKIEVHPMDYEEFCEAVWGNYALIEEVYAFSKPIGDSVNRTLMRDFRTYIAVGGMPQAVEAYINKKNFNDVDKVKRGIIELYKNDLMKIDNSGRLSRMYESIPSQLVAKKNRFSFGYGLGKKTPKDDERLFDLIDSKIVNACYGLLDVSPSLSLYTDTTKFKLYVGDTGLFVTMLFNADDGEHEDVYKKLLSDKLDLNLGYLYENVVAQMITSSDRGLYYFPFYYDGSTKEHEVDFLLSKGGKVLPLEVKSSKTKSHRSIDCFAEKYSKHVASRYLISCKDRYKEGNLLNLPFYLFPCFLKGLA